ncbi:hypothetical protein UFOVP74_26 [uncultured Caudovirales phage]|uniref:Uncharacterized protein n=1 Tax=uncultured Caudovirales phage TaxID=2100421 RepID=A0A6J5KYS9_9CAUD|nr:hypothetical protein UFOVP74_26 [uncultured Caudovirales phage]
MSTSHENTCENIGNGIYHLKMNGVHTFTVEESKGIAKITMDEGTGTRNAEMQTTPEVALHLLLDFYKRTHRLLESERQAIDELLLFLSKKQLHYR